MQDNNYPLVLLYHEVDEKASPLLNYYNINVHPKVFDQQIKMIKSFYCPINFSEFVEAYESGTDIRERILITFDDGYKSAVQKAVPILQKYDIESIWFLNSSFWNNDRIFWLSKLMWIYDQGLLKLFINQANLRWPGILSLLSENPLPVDVDRWAKDCYSTTLKNFIDEFTNRYGLEERPYSVSNQLYATKDDLNKSSCSIEYGNHTASHPNLRNISLKQVKNEIVECHDKIKKELLQEPNCFAFPFGEPGHHWNPYFINILKQIGYRWIFSVENNDYLVSSNLWRGVIPRHIVPTDVTSKSSLQAFINSKFY